MSNIILQSFDVTQNVNIFPNLQTFSGGIALGSFTTSQLQILNSSGGNKVGSVFCSDCITPYGIGGMSYWDSTSAQFRLYESNIKISTFALDFYRGAYEVGFIGGNKKYSALCMHQCIGAEPFFVKLNGGGNSRNFLVPDGSLWDEIHTSGSSSGGAHIETFFLPPPIRMTSAYMATQIYLPLLSTSGDEYQVRIGFDQMIDSLGSDYIGITYDRGNVNGFNTGNTNTYWIQTKSNSGNTNTVDTVITPSINSANPDLIELFFETIPTTQLTIFINGNQMGNPYISLSSAQLAPQLTILKSVGINERDFRFTNFGWGFMAL